MFYIPANQYISEDWLDKSFSINIVKSWFYKFMKCLSVEVLQ